MELCASFLIMRQHSATLDGLVSLFALSEVVQIITDEVGQTVCQNQEPLEGLLGVFSTAESQCTRAIIAGGHQEQLSVLIIAVCFWEVPDGTLWLVVVAAPQNAGSRVLVFVFIGPLPDITNHILDSEGAGSSRMSVHVRGVR